MNERACIAVPRGRICFTLARHGCIRAFLKQRPTGQGLEEFRQAASRACDLGKALQYSALDMLIVVLPAYNEAENLPPLLDRIAAALAGIAHRVIVVDDGSTDATAAIAEGRTRAGVLLERNPCNMGLSATLKRGLIAAMNHATRDDDVVVTMDADNTQPPELIERMLDGIRAGSDLVIASRYRNGAQVRGLSVSRRGLSLGARVLFRATLPIHGVRDYTCGFRAYRAKLLRDAFAALGPDQLLVERGFSCMVDMLLRLRDFNPTVTEVPLDLRYDFKRGASKMKIARTVGATLRLMVRHRFGRRQFAGARLT